MQGLHLDIGSGECLALVGPSGCGKSTALRIASGLLFPDHGRILCDGHDITRTPANERRFGMVTQQNALTPRRSAGRHIALPLEFRGEPAGDIEERVRAEAHQFSVEHLLRRYRSQLSGGEVQAVQLARALVARPRVLLLDEPLARIDLDLRLKLRADVARVRKEYGLTTLLVTADQEDALVLGDRIAVLDRGRLQQVGSPMAVYGRPVNVMVARFLGEPSMNVFEAPVRIVDGQRSYQIGRQSFPAHPPVADRFIDDRALVGVRPESIRIVSAPGRESAARPPLPATVTRSELRGSTTVVVARLDGPSPVELAVVVPGVGPQIGREVGLVLDPSQFHLFDRYTEAALHHPV